MCGMRAVFLFLFWVRLKLVGAVCLVVCFGDLLCLLS